jgi:hypothetical protein
VSSPVNGCIERGPITVVGAKRTQSVLSTLASAMHSRIARSKSGSEVAINVTADSLDHRG